MKKSADFSGKVMHLDKSVWLVMAFTLAISVILLGFKRLGTKECALFFISVDGKEESGVAVREPGRLLLFALKQGAAGQVTWNFGDGTGLFKGQSASHRFAKEGYYKVEARLNGGCVYEQILSIRKPLYMGREEDVEIKILEAPVNPKAGELVRFYGLSNVDAKQYEWRLLNSADAVQFGPVAAFNFPGPGSYKVQLKLDNDPRKVRVKTITIAAEPMVGGFPGAADVGGGLPPADGGGGMPQTPFPQMEPAAPGKPNTTEPIAEPAKPEVGPKKAISPATFQGMLQEVIAGNKEVSELYPFLFYGESTKVQEEGKPLLVNIGPFCREMARRSGAQIESVEFSKDGDNIHIIKVKVTEQERRKGLLGRLFGGKG